MPILPAASLDLEELTVLYAMLAYPNKIIHLILRYYVKRDGKSILACPQVHR